jgi:hypothetical protein
VNGHYEIRFSQDAVRDVRALRAFERSRGRTAIE